MLQVPRAETVSVLTSLRDFRARMPNGGACSGSDAETSNSESEYSDDASDVGSETDDEPVQDEEAVEVGTVRLLRLLSCQTAAVDCCSAMSEKAAI